MYRASAHGTGPGAVGGLGAPIAVGANSGSQNNGAREAPLDLRGIPPEQRLAASQYNGLLDALTCNSKEIINNLTKIAGENIANASGIASTIEHRLLTTEPMRKLPYLYLLDSIVKNIGGVYIQRFARNLFHCFNSRFYKNTP